MPERSISPGFSSSRRERSGSSVSSSRSSLVDMSNSVPQVLGVLASPFVGFWLAGELGTPPIITAVVVVWVYVKVADVTVYLDYA